MELYLLFKILVKIESVCYMVRTKTKKQRGSRTYGRGKKGGRGAGLRGGHGNAGLHKHKFTYMIKYMPNHFGRYGFKRPVKEEDERVINVGQLEEFFPGKNEINLREEGFDKLLGKGSITSRVKIIVSHASEKAVEKITAQGGEVVLEENIK